MELLCVSAVVFFTRGRPCRAFVLEGRPIEFKTTGMST